MTEGPEQIREEIEETRARMGERVDALGYKADVPARSREYVAEKKDRLVSRLGGATPDGEQVKEGTRKAAGLAKENPLGLAVGAAAAGFLVGLALPSTRMENERMGELADDVKQRAREVGEEAVERGKEVAQHAGEAAKATVEEEGRAQGEELASSAQSKGRAVGGD